jgi:hypothetical protein
MSTDRPFAPVRAATYEAADPEGRRLRNSIEPEPVEWHVAVHAAASLLDEMFGPPGSAADPAITDMARDLAARLCAYHEIVEVVEQTRMHEPAPPAQSSHPGSSPEGPSSPGLSPGRRPPVRSVPVRSQAGS